MLFISHALITLRDKLVAADKERGATAVEYGIMVAAIAALIIGVVFTLGGDLRDMFDGINLTPGTGGGGGDAG
ncbi:Flp family type IVb pilin [Ornithinimicrobium sufpigmenti]|uniref:Flp family type IVb pilin n=1 Tax=Ornithinimicrobium sufpigmenti TaxID=2508882 RepID=UPI0010367555|nr:MULTISPECIES: Flp family type IVb pilin [unclassified Ornithinimicrobium]